MIEIPDGATPADVVGETDILAGQDWLNKAKLLHYAEWMLYGRFPWEAMQEMESMYIQQGSNGKVLGQGHHRWEAARIAGIQIPVTIEIRQDFWPDPVPFAYAWYDVVWERERNDPIPFRR